MSKTPRKPARKNLTGKDPLKVPPILLESDRPSISSLGGPGQRYALGPAAPIEHLESEGELPESYGTQEMILTARDPHWLYAHWDLTDRQQRHYNSLSRDRHLVVRVHFDSLRGQVAAEVHVHPESRHWFVYVGKAGTRYVAQLGYYDKHGHWVMISPSTATLTPPDSVSSDTTAEFATVPFEVPMSKLLALVKEAVQQHKPLAQALQELRHDGHPDLPPMTGAAGSKPWTPAQEQALSEVISMDKVRRIWVGSLEITELIRRQAARELASIAAAQFSAPSSPGVAWGQVSSPAGGEKPAAKGFWFNVNAELIVYGATEPGAHVTIGGRAIKLRPDGSFSYRFALPDGEYELPIVAVSADGTDGRAAEIRFIRGTEYRGEVGAHPQDPELRRPEAASF